MSLLNLGSAALFAGDVERSKPLLAEALTIALDIDDRLAQFYLLDMIACGSVASGRAAEGAQLFGAAATVQRAAGANVMPFLESALAAYQAKAEAALGTQEYEAQLGAGRRLHREQAAAMALDRRPDAVTGPAHTDTGPLSKRELEVARLLAEGLTNKEIGSRLFISERTVDTHVRKILDKLGFNSRSQVAAWAGRQAAANEPE
ncbi:MAG: response regulator transcription factor [Acidimicrobiaceae bacterium]|nr:response regulator transcription factor [Acidimicrobiaceae bacterium]